MRAMSQARKSLTNLGLSASTRNQLCGSPVTYVQCDGLGDAATVAGAGRPLIGLGGSTDGRLQCSECRPRRTAQEQRVIVIYLSR